MRQLLVLFAVVHSYLGDVEDVARGAILAEGSIVRLPLILLGGVVLFPGETLPLRLYNTDYIR
jgi:cereblon